MMKPPVTSQIGVCRWLPALLLCASVSMTGCAVVPVIPPAEGYSLETPEDLVIDESTRAEILMRFGCPDSRHHGDRYLVYGWDELHALGIWFLFWLGGGAEPIGDTHRLVLEFSTDGRLVRKAEVSAFVNSRADRKVRQWIEKAEGEVP